MPVYLPEDDIREEAMDVLRVFEKKHGNIQHFVPLDDVVEQTLGIHLEVFDNQILPPSFHDQVLGYINLKTGSISPSPEPDFSWK